MGSDVRTPDHPIDPLFVNRWSPRAMSGEPIAERELLTLFEAARWAPSSGNSQPWRFLYARRDTPHWPLFLGVLVERNREWCAHAAALVVFISHTTHEETGPAAAHAQLRHRRRLGELRLPGLVDGGRSLAMLARADMTKNTELRTGPISAVLQ